MQVNFLEYFFVINKQLYLVHKIVLAAKRMYEPHA